ncbi:MAG TPA: hypothetical protein VJM31_16365 [Vicinamibacterales bacterium]|nr:hypothetical protein [Vicinamibacterales bacterium]
MRNGSVWLRSVLVVVGEERYRISDGRQLKLSRGVIRCRVSFPAVVPGAAAMTVPRTHPVWSDGGHGERDEDHIVSILEIADRDGKVFRCERIVSSKRFFDLVRVPIGHEVQEGARSVLESIYCTYDRRLQIAAVGPDNQPVVYIGKQLTVTFDLLAHSLGNMDTLVVRVHPKRGQAIGGEAPQVVADTLWSARVVLAHDLLSDIHLGTEEPVFVPVPEASDDPQPHVDAVTES